jgi:hypothetical protein
MFEYSRLLGCCAVSSGPSSRRLLDSEDENTTINGKVGIFKNQHGVHIPKYFKILSISAVRNS